MMADMHHPTEDRLEAFAEGLLADGDRVVIESHLLGCPECETRVEEWRALFAALSGLPQYEPVAGFADRVMARVRVAPARVRELRWQRAQAAVRVYAGHASDAVSRVMPKTTFGWAMATAFMALPFLVMGAILAWLMSHSYVTPASLWAFFGTQVADGARSVGTTAVSTAMQTELAAWLYGYGAAFLERAGVTGVGVVIAVACATTALSIWVLYRNLFRTPTRETNYVSLSI